MSHHIETLIRDSINGDAEILDPDTDLIDSVILLRDESQSAYSTYFVTIVSRPHTADPNQTITVENRIVQTRAHAIISNERVFLTHI